MKKLYVSKDACIYFDKTFPSQPWVVQTKFLFFFWRVYACCLTKERALSLARTVSECRFFHRGN